MSLTIPNNEPLPAGIVSQQLSIGRVLYEAETPVVFLTQTEYGQQLLAYVADETVEGTFTLLAPVSERSLAALERGTLSVRDALTASWMWLHVAAPERGDVWDTGLEELPEACLPRPSTPLVL